MSLDILAGAATRELLEQVPPDPERLLVDLRHTRRRRTVVRSATALAALVLVIGTVALRAGNGDGDDRPDPAPPAPRTGAVVAPSDSTAGVWRHFTSFGAGLRLPLDAEPFPSGEFTADGSELVYPGPRHTMQAVDVTNGTTRILGICLDELCDPDLSPDGTRLVYGAEEHLKIQDVATGDARPVQIPGVEQAAMPAWSPDGRTIAFTGPDGIYTVDLETEKVRRLHRSTTDAGVFLGPAWSPDGRTLAFLDPRPRPDDPNGESTFTLMTVGADGSGLRELHAAGHCLCLGIPYPALTWSPDGELIAVSVTQSSDGAGIYTIHPDGTGWKLLHPGVYGDVDWQPTAD